MKKLVLIAVLLASPGAKASVFGEENAALYQLVGLQAQQMADVAAMLANIRLVLAGVNDVAGGVRAGNRIYKTIKNYSTKDLIHDAKAGLYAAFPDLRIIDSEIADLRGNLGAAEQGTFFTHWDKHDAKMNQVLNAAFRQAYRSSIWPTVFQNAFKEDAVQRNPVDDLILSRFQQSGQAMRVAIQDTALRVLVNKADALVQDGEDKGRTDLQALALNAQLSAQNVNNTTRLRDLAEHEAAARESSARATKAYDQSARQELANNVDRLLWSGVAQP